MLRLISSLRVLLICPCLALISAAQQPASPPIVLHAARLLEVDTGHLIQPGEVLVEGERIRAVGTSVEHPQGARVIDLGDTTLLPGMIDAHVHLFLHPGAEDLQTVVESVPWRTILREQAAKADLMAGFTAERDMGTEGAGSADTAVRNAINQGLIPGPRMRVSGNAIDILGGHEDAIGYNPAQHVLSNADYANSAEQIVEVMREQHKEGSDFAKIYETGPDRMMDGVLHTPYQYTEAQLTAAVKRRARLGTDRWRACHGRAGHALRRAGGRGFHRPRHAAQRRDHAPDEAEGHLRRADLHHLRILRRASRVQDQAAREAALLDYKIAEFKKQVAAGVPFAVGSDVGPFPHGTQARELTLMVEYGMTPLAVLQADMINGAKLLGWQGQIGELKPAIFADIIAVPGNPLEDISVVEHVGFVMKGGAVVRQ